MDPQKKYISNIILISVLLSALTGFFSGGLAFSYLTTKYGSNGANNSITAKNISISSEDSAVTQLVEKTNASVVSIIITQDLPKINQRMLNSPFDLFFGPQTPNGSNNSAGATEKKEVGGGSGFIISKNGLIMTNKHVVDTENASYTVLLNSGEKVPAKIIAKHPAQDLALIKIEKDNLSPVEFASSKTIKVGQTAVAIGNALGEFNNTVSKGVISGLSRSIVASDSSGESSERLNNIIQTDAAINPGNSGGPLFDISGKVIGVNVAVAQGAQGIGFALPSNLAVKMIQDVEKYGKVRVPYLGVRYTIIDKTLKETNNLSYENGALISGGSTQNSLAVIPGSPADKASLKENDIILSINGTIIDLKHTLSDLLENYDIGQTITLHIASKGAEKDVQLTLEERPNN